MNTADFEIEIKKFIIETLNLEAITPEDIDSHAPLFGEGLGLDSIDALELGVAMKQKYNITLNSDDPAIREHFRSVSHLAKFMSDSRAL
jgi:acyl carrier protein